MVTSADWQAVEVCLSDEQPGSGAIELTLPTLTPAIRTSASGRRPFAFENTACTVYWLANGLANFVYAR